MARGRNIKGITVVIDGDATPLSNALKSVNSTIRETQLQLSDVTRLLKLDPSNTELLTQKQRLLEQAVGATKEKLDTLKEAEKQVQAQIQAGKANQEKYEALRQEVQETEHKLSDLKAAEKDAQEQFDQGKISQEQYDALRKEVEDTEKELVTLKQQEEQVQQQIKKGQVSQEQYEALGREIIETESKLGNLSDQSEKTNAQLADATAAQSAQQGLQDDIEKTSAKTASLGDETERTGERGADSIGKMSSAFVVAQAATMLLMKAIATVKSSLDAAFSRIDTMEQFQRTMTAITGNAQAAGDALEELKEITTGTAYGLDVAAKATQDFVTRGMSIGDATTRIGIWADAVAFYGQGTNEQLTTVSDALAKMETKGKVSMEQLNRLFDVGIDAVGMYATATQQSTDTVQEALSGGKISATQFIDTVSDAMTSGTNGVQKIAGAAKEAGTSWTGTFDNMKAATSRGVVSIIENIEAGLVSGGLPNLRQGLADTGKQFEKFLQVIADVAKDLVRALAPALSGAMQALKFLSPVLEATLRTFGDITPVILGTFAAFKTATAVDKAIKSFKSASDAVKLATDTMGGLIVVMGNRTAAETLLAAATSKSTAMEGLRTAMKAKGIVVSEAGTLMTAKGVALTEAESAALLKSAGAVGIKTALMGGLTSITAIGTVITQAFNAAWAANPIGMVVIAIAALIAGIIALVKWMKRENAEQKKLREEKEKLIQSSNDLTTAIESNNEAYEAGVSDIKNNAKVSGDLAKQLFDLSKKENKSAEEKARMKVLTDQLNKSLGDQNLLYDAEADALNMTEEAVYGLIDAKMKEAQAQAMQERAIELAKARLEIEDQIRQLEEKKAEAVELYGEGTRRAAKETQEFDEQITTLQGNLETTTESERMLAEQMVEVEQQTTDATDAFEGQKETLEGLSEEFGMTAEEIQTAVSASGVSLDEWAGKHRDTSDEIQKTYEKLESKTTDAFDRIKLKSALSFKDMMANLKHNQDATAKWADNLAILAAKGCNGLVAKMREAGPESALQVESLVNMSDEQLNKLEGVMKKGTQQGVDVTKQVVSDPSFTNSGSDAVDKIAAGVDQNKELERSMAQSVIDSKTAAQTQVSSSNFPSVGEQMVNGMITGINNRKSALTATMAGIAKTAVEQAKSSLDIHSPSRVMEKLGGFTVEGFMVGLQGMTSKLNASMRSLFTDVIPSVNDSALALSGGRNVSNMPQAIHMTQDNREILSALEAVAARPITLRVDLDGREIFRSVDENAGDALRRLSYMGGGTW